MAYSQPSKLAFKYLAGLKGIEIGGSAHNQFYLNTKNVDITTDFSSTYKQMERDACGRAMQVDVIASGDNLPFEDNSVDFVISSHVLEHFYDPIKAIEEWYRIVKNGGYIFAIIPHKERIFDKERPRTTLTELIARHENNTPAEAIDDHFSVWITEDVLELIKYLGYELADYQDVDDKVRNGFTVVIQVIKNDQAPHVNISAANKIMYIVLLFTRYYPMRFIWLCSRIWNRVKVITSR